VGPSLRIEEFAITNFRTFTTRTVIPFRGSAGQPDEIATFHGDNGSGKSNALAALNLFFDALIRYLTSDQSASGKDLAVDWPVESKIVEEQSKSPGLFFRDDVLFFRDRPALAEGPTDLETRFTDERLGILRVRFTPAGKRVYLRVDQAQLASKPLTPGFSPIPAANLASLLTWIETPYGPGSDPHIVLDSHRSGAQRPLAASAGLDNVLVEKLFKLRTSLLPQDRDRWRSFAELLQRFSPFRNREVSIDRLQANGPPALTLEERGKSVLELKELSSGEQQLVRLCAVATSTKAPLLAIEEPELSLDVTNQRLIKEILREQIRTGLRDQVILESHVPTFDDGPSVIRFARGPTGETVVTRAPVTDDARRHELEERAKKQGAAAQWVTRDGYTQLPVTMREDLHLAQGGHLWFLKGHRTWEAWPEAQLTELLADPKEKEGDE